jgi:BA14K-like protein
VDQLQTSSFVPPRKGFFRRAGSGCCAFAGDESMRPLLQNPPSHHEFEIIAKIPERSTAAEVLPDIFLWRSEMSKLGILGATALSLTLAVAAPALAAGRGGGGMHGGGGGMHAGGGMGGGMRGGGGAMHVGGGGGGMHFGGGMASGMRGGGGAAAFRGAQANMAPGAAVSPSHPINAGGGNFVGRGGGQFAQGGYRGGFRDHDHGRHFRPGFGFAAGLAAGSALGYGYGYSDPYYYDDYAYNDYNDYYDDGNAGYVADPGYVVSVNADPAYCAQRYKSYDPASGTYLGYDGLRHPCGQ